ncbi:MAG TPA: DUF4399 domain-containing protein [Methylomirabilota bacterium]|nr:DUF4399 domain-containing protein [Methylomirabilota bacterium]
MRSTMAALGAVLFLAAGPAGKAAAAPDHNPIIVSPKDGAVMRSPVTVTIDLNGAEVASHSTGTMAAMPGMTNMPAGGKGAHHGHAHLIVDSPLPKAGAMIPMDAKHIHMMGGAAKTTLRLPPGKHTLQLIMGGDDHIVPPDAPRSTPVTITVQ